MTTMFNCARLNPVRFPLVARFYKTHYPSGKPKKNEIIWTLEQQHHIIGAVRFRQFEDAQLLTGLAIAQDFQRQGLGAKLMQAVQPQISERACYCFAYAHLESFYRQANFELVDASQLPNSLQSLFTLYCSSGKNLISMQCKNNQAVK